MGIISGRWLMDSVLFFQDRHVELVRQNKAALDDSLTAASSG